MRLIDADAFKEEMGTETKIRRMVCSAIDKQPTVFDLDKVVEKLEARQDDIQGDVSLHDFYIQGYSSAIDYAIEIVKRGGIDELRRN